jgi:HK97 family phage major capsid protein
MPYNTLVQRSDVAARIPSRVSNIMLNSLRDSSAALTLGNRIPLPAGATTFPVLSALPTAYWVNGDTGLKQTTTMAWASKSITVEELAAIVPVPDNVFDDADFDVWEEIRPALETAIAREIDKTVFLNQNKPASFPTGIAAAAVAAPLTNSVTVGTATAAEGGITKDISDLIGKLEAQGYYPTKAVANAALRGTVRNMSLVPAQNVPGGASMVTQGDWFGADVSYPLRGAWPSGAGAVQAIIGDFDQMVVGIRKDFTWKLITEGVISDGAGAIQFNLPQQDMTALRVVFRMGWQVANPINWDQPDPTKRYPFGVLKAA